MRGLTCPRGVISCAKGIISCFIANDVNFTTNSSSILNSEHSPWDAISSDPSPYFDSKDIPEQWWEINFNREVVIESYKIFSGSDGWGSLLRNWNISVSNDSVDWYIVDFHRDTSIINVPFQFYLQSKVVCKVLRVYSAGPSSTGNNRLVISYLEFFSPFASYSSIHPYLFHVDPCNCHQVGIILNFNTLLIVILSFEY